jgi:hypothetical protein
MVEAPTDSTGSASSSPVRRGRARANVALDAAAGSIEITLAGDIRLTLRGRVDVKGLRAVLAALRSS